MSLVEKKLDWIGGLMQEQLRWYRLAGMNQLRTIFEKNLPSEEDKQVYELSDGERSVRDIEKIVKTGRTKIAILWKKWYMLGIMEKSQKYEGRRMKRSFSLADVGIEVSLPGINENEDDFE